MKKLKRWAMALLLLPFCYGVARGLWFTLTAFKDVPEGSYWFFAGIFSYFAFQWAFFTPMRTYVFGHELTHALAAWMSGGQVKKFHVSKHGGHVHVTKSNFFVSLAPYMVPLYSILILGAILILKIFYPLQAYWRGLLWVLGISVGFHLALTYFALQQKQPDLKPTGRLLSAVIIFLGNATIAVVMLSALFPKTVSLVQFARQSGHHTWAAWEQVGRGGAAIYREAVHDVAR